MNRVPALGDRLLRTFQSAIESFNCVFGAVRQHVASRLESEHQPMKTLQKRVMEFSRDARPLGQPFGVAEIDPRGHLT